jgi:glycosyltransferase involved in cell wall biosynthesis
MVKIAVYTIALNEEKHVAQWVEATKDADYRLVCDTGSTDKTVELLKKHKINTYKISVKPWRFDSARNTALNLVPDDVDVCLILDMDEVPEPGFFDKVREQWISTANRGWVGLNTGSTWAADRLHSRQGFVWKYACHEVAVPSMGTEVEYCFIQATIEHKPDNTKSRGQYLDMLKECVNEMPDDMRMRVYLIREYYFAGKWQELIDEGQRLFAHDRVGNCWLSELAAAYRGAGDAYDKLGSQDLAKEMYEKGMEVAPNEMEAVFPLAYWHYVNKNWQECFDLANKVNELKPGGHYLVDESIYKWRAFDLLAIASWNLGKKGSAKKWGRLAVEGNPTDKRLIDNYEFMLKGQTNGM